MLNERVENISYFWQTFKFILNPNFRNSQPKGWQLYFEDVAYFGDFCMVCCLPNKIDKALEDISYERGQRYAAVTVNVPMLVSTWLT